MTESPDVIIGEVLPDEKADGKKKQLVPRKSDNVAFGSFITKSNDLIQRTKYSLPRNEQKILFMMLSKIDQRHDMDASKYYTISFDDFAKLTGVNALDSFSSKQRNSPPIIKRMALLCTLPLCHTVLLLAVTSISYAVWRMPSVHCQDKNSGPVPMPMGP